MSDETKLPAVADHRPAPVAFGGSGIEIRTFDDAARFAKVVFDSGLAPHGFNSPQAVMVALQAGMEVGLPPMQAIQSVAVINGRPCMWGDAIPALLWAAGFDIEETMSEDGTVATCTITRPNGRKITRTFSADDAKAAGLWQTEARVTRRRKDGGTYETDNDSPWFKYRPRMLQMRARSWACRDGAADVLRGMIIREEAEDIGPAAARDITPERVDPLIAAAAAAKLAQHREEQAQAAGARMRAAIAEEEQDEKDTASPAPPQDLAHEVLTFSGQSWSRTTRGAQDWANAIGKAIADANSAGDRAGALAILTAQRPALDDVADKLPASSPAAAAILAVLDYGAQIEDYRP